MTIPKIFSSEALRPGMTITVYGGEFKYLSQVLRLQAGDEILIMDGKNGRFPGRLAEMAAEAATIEVVGPKDQTNELADITLGQALVKGKSMDSLIEKAAEMGVSRVIPFHCQRSIPHLGKEKLGLKTERWCRLARERARQVGRASFPHIEKTMPFSAMLEAMPDQALRLIFWEEERKQDIREIFASRARRSTPLAIVIGPEGGFTDREVAEARQRGFTSVSLGPQVFKVETALMVVMAIIQYELGYLDCREDRGGEK